MVWMLTTRFFNSFLKVGLSIWKERTYGRFQETTFGSGVMILRLGKQMVLQAERRPFTLTMAIIQIICQQPIGRLLQ